MGTDLGYDMFDADNHFYEGRDAFTRYLDPRYAGEFLWMTDERGRTHVILHGKFWPYIPNPTFDPIAVPGSMELMFRGKKSRQQLAAEGIHILEPLASRPEYMDRSARLKRMDEQGIEACWMFPTMVSGVEHQTSDDVDLTYALLNALNRWILDEWGFGAEGRIYSMPVVSLADPDRAVAQLELGLEHGARAVMMRPSPVPTALGYRSPGDPMFDPFWARAAEANVAVTCHAGETGYHEYAGDWTGRRQLEPFKNVNPTDMMFVEGRAVADFITALTVHGTFDRHPALRVVTVENGCGWVPDLMRRFRKYYSHYREAFPGDPFEQFSRNIWISPFWEDDIAELAQYLPVEHILAGSDWPHAEGLSEPTDFAKSLHDFDAATQRLIMRENGLALVS
jgi:predicted TIM-barrel fold metal-dependent hydrolase